MRIMSRFYEPSPIPRCDPSFDSLSFEELDQYYTRMAERQRSEWLNRIMEAAAEVGQDARNPHILTLSVIVSDLVEFIRENVPLSIIPEV